MGIFSNKKSFSDSPLTGRIGTHEFTFQCAYAMRDSLFPEDNWSVVLYDQQVEKKNINIAINNDQTHFPHIYFKIKKDPEVRFYNINIMGTYGPGKKGTIVSAWLNKLDYITFHNGELELLDFDLQKGIISARIVAYTKDKKNYINGTFTIRIDGGLVTSDDKTLSPLPLEGQFDSYKFSFSRGYALPNFLSPGAGWNVLLYDKDVYPGDIHTSGRFDQNNFPSIAINIDKDSAISNYTINTVGIGSSSMRGTVASICTGLDERVTFEAGQVEVLEINHDAGFIKARMWAITYNGKYKLKGTCTIDIVQPQSSITDDSYSSEEVDLSRSQMALLLEAKRIYDIISGPQKKILAMTIEKYETALVEAEEQRHSLQSLLEQIIKEGPLQH